MIVDFPTPDEPTNAMVRPSFTYVLIDSNLRFKDFMSVMLVLLHMC